MFMRFLVVLTLYGLVACDPGKAPQDDAKATPTTSESQGDAKATPTTSKPQGGNKAMPTAADVFTNTRPAEAPNLAGIKAKAVTGDTVTFLARVGGKRKAFIDGLSIFNVADPKLTSCELMGDEDHCAKPWDYCCEDKDVLTAGLATVRLTDGEGKVLKKSAEGQGELEALKFVVITGIVREKNDEGLFVVDASKIWVGGKPNRGNPLEGSGG